jgi:hypothetical protein
MTEATGRASLSRAWGATRACGLPSVTVELQLPSLARIGPAAPVCRLAQRLSYRPRLAGPVRWLGLRRANMGTETESGVNVRAILR